MKALERPITTKWKARPMMVSESILANRFSEIDFSHLFRDMATLYSQMLMIAACGS
jgi:hypothetical protein